MCLLPRWSHSQNMRIPCLVGKALINNSWSVWYELLWKVLMGFPSLYSQNCFRIPDTDGTKNKKSEGHFWAHRATCAVGKYRISSVVYLSLNNMLHLEKVKGHKGQSLPKGHNNGRLAMSMPCCFDVMVFYKDIVTCQPCIHYTIATRRNNLYFKGQSVICWRDITQSSQAM